jgi:hypothetical protein
MNNMNLSLKIIYPNSKRIIIIVVKEMGPSYNSVISYINGNTDN